MDAVIEGPNFEFSTESHEVRSCFCSETKLRASLQITCKWHHACELVLSRLHWHLSVTTVLLPVFAFVSYRVCGLCGWSWAGQQLESVVAWAMLLSTGFGALAQDLLLCNS